jgi:hypothetical protein
MRELAADSLGIQISLARWREQAALSQPQGLKKCRLREDNQMSHSIIDVENLATEISCCEIARALVDKPTADNPCQT